MVVSIVRRRSQSKAEPKELKISRSGKRKVSSDPVREGNGKTILEQVVRIDIRRETGCSRD